MAEHGGSISKNLTTEEFLRFRDHINQQSGIYLEESKIDSLRISLVTRCTRFGLTSLDEYFELLSIDESELRELVNLLTVNETSFFRYSAQFDVLRDKVIPEILEQKTEGERSFRVWSAGCSTGEEPYTIAMTLIDSGIESMGYKLEVMGTDVSTSALERAEKGVYAPRSLLNVPSNVVDRFFEPTPEGHRITQEVRSLVEFKYHNLIKEPYPVSLIGSWDVIFCRNVTIYFRMESTRRVVENLFQSLNPGGYLFIGHSEALTGITDKFEALEFDGIFLYRKPRKKVAQSFAELVKSRLRERRSRALASKDGEGEAKDSKAARKAPQHGPAESDSPSEPVKPDEVPALLDRAREALAGGRPIEALEAVERVLAVNKDSAEAYLFAAYVHADNGDFEAALAEAERALSIDPLSAAARYSLGLIHLRTDRPEEATADFKRTIYTDADFVLAYLNLGNLYRARGRFADACREYEDALRALYRNPEGEWSVFLGGFKPDLLAKVCERSLLECRKKIESA